MDRADARSDADLKALRAWLRRDLLSEASWRSSLVETAEAARAAVGGRRAFIVLKDAGGAWSGFLGNGTALVSEGIPLIASLTLLEDVSASQQPIVTSISQPLVKASRSISRNDLRNVLVVPLRRWRSVEGRTESASAGCLYVDRPGDEAPFEQADIDLVLDIANVLERTLGVLWHLSDVEKELARTRRRQEAEAEAEYEAFQLHSVTSREPGFVRGVLEPLKRAARAERVGVLLNGPTGSGKSHLAQSFHYESRRRAGPFVVLDCGQVSSSEALGAELFGFTRSSGFSAPKEGRLGKAALADGGTLFLDEVGTLPLELQQRLLRLIQHGRFTPLGASEEVEVDVQVLAATNEDLTGLVRAKRFREDLYWRLAEVAIRVPPLDERRLDIPDLASLFLGRAAERFDRRGLTSLEPDALQRLVAFPWSRAGNTRGLEHAVNRSVLLSPDDRKALELDDLVLPELLEGPQEASPTAPVPAAPRASLDELLPRLIAEHGGVIAKLANDPRLAAAFGLPSGPVPASTVRLRIRRLGLEEQVTAARDRAEVRLDQVVATVRKHRSVSRAAEELGLTRDALTWRLRQAGVTLRRLLGESSED